MGGEYLPDLYSSEVEIARVTLKSTTMDVISIRARRTKHRIKYRIVDEYCDDPTNDYFLIQKSSVRPLTMKQLIRLIDHAQERGLDGEARYFNYAYGCSDPRELFDFATITSEYYPELEDWYDESNQDWLDQELDRISRDDESEGISDHTEEELKEWAEKGIYETAYDQMSQEHSNENDINNPTDHPANSEEE